MATLNNKKRYKKVATMTPSKNKEQNFEQSKTVPDQSLTVRQIMVRFANGTLNEIEREAFYNEDLPDTRGLDISQRKAMAENAKSDYAQMVQSVKEAKAAKKAAAQQKEIEDAKIVE